VNAFKAKLEPVPHGGLYVVVPLKVAADAQLAHGARVRGTVNGVAYRSSLMRYSGVFHLGVHKATVATASVVAGARVEVTIEIDDEPLPTDRMPDDLSKALAHDPEASASWQKLAPAVRRGFVKDVIDAKQKETRVRRITRIVGRLHKGVPPRSR
jgi:hypothetical protein